MIKAHFQRLNHLEKSFFDCLIKGFLEKLLSRVVLPFLPILKQYVALCVVHLHLCSQEAEQHLNSHFLLEALEERYSLHRQFG